jgi:hypothetical protein
MCSDCFVTYVPGLYLDADLDERTPKSVSHVFGLTCRLHCTVMDASFRSTSTSRATIDVQDHDSVYDHVQVHVQLAPRPRLASS